VPLVVRDLLKALLRGASFTDLPLRVPLPTISGRFVTPAQMQGELLRRAISAGGSFALHALSSMVGVGAVKATLMNVADGAVSGLDRTVSGISSGNVAGAAIGLGSVVTNTVSSVVGSAAGVTGAVGNMASALAGNEGNVRTNRPSDVFSGLSKGAVDVGKGLMKGLTGIVTKPVQGFQRGGLEGLAEGTMRGLVGVVAAPVGGVVTGVTRVLQGVEGQLQSREITEARREASTRRRPKRAFYGPGGLVRPYVIVDAEWAARLRTLGGGGFAGERLVHVEGALKDASVAVLVTTRSVLVVRTARGGGASPAPPSTPSASGAPTDAGTPTPADVAASAAASAASDVSVIRQVPLSEVVKAEARADGLALLTVSGEAGLRCRSKEQAGTLADAIAAARAASQVTYRD
jgi:hypothetical protein